MLPSTKSSGQVPQRQSPKQKHNLDSGCSCHDSPRHLVTSLAWRGPYPLGHPLGHPNTHRSVHSAGSDLMFTESLLTPGNSILRRFYNLSQIQSPPHFINMLLTAPQEMKHFTITHNRRDLIPTQPSALRDQVSHRTHLSVFCYCAH